MGLRIKWIMKTIVITVILGSVAYAGDEPPQSLIPPVPPLEKGGILQKGEGVEDAIKIPDVVATINGTVITKQELEGRMAQTRSVNPEGFDAMGLEERKKAIIQTIDSMILREIIYQEAVRKGIVITDEEVDLNLDSIKRQFPSEDAFEKALADANVTMPAWKEETKKNLTAVKLEEMAVAGLKIDDQEIADNYEKVKEKMNKDAIKVSHILTKTEEEAIEIIKELEEKKDFADLAKRYSQDAFTKDKGGDLGWYGKGELLKEVEDAAWSLSPGQISAPVKSQYGYHIIQMNEKKGASEQTLEDHREHVRSLLQQARWKQMRFEWVRALGNKAVIWKWSP